MHRFASLLFRAALATSLLAPVVDAQQVTVGTYNGGNCYPFVCMSGDGMPTRYQQVYASSAFSTGPVSISALTFYSRQAGFTDGNNYQINFSTTSMAVNGLSSNANANVGADNATFFNGALSTAINPSFTVSGTPFVYDPGAGNLLMDVFITGPYTQGYVAFMDADYSGSQSSRTWNYQGTTNVDSGALVTTFDTAVATPEPASMLLVGSGLAGIAFIRRRKKV